LVTAACVELALTGSVCRSSSVAQQLNATSKTIAILMQWRSDMFISSRV
jgi:hypothetical protein